jgi:hypothetical protein
MPEIPIKPVSRVGALPEELVGCIAGHLPRDALKSLKRAHPEFGDVVEDRQVKRLRTDFNRMEAALAPAAPAKPAVAAAGRNAGVNLPAAGAPPTAPQPADVYDSDGEETRLPTTGALWSQQTDIKNYLTAEPWASPLRRELQARSVNVEQALDSRVKPLLDQQANYRNRAAPPLPEDPYANLWDAP